MEGKYSFDINPKILKESAERRKKFQEELLHDWLKTCPFDYLMVGKIKGIRTVNFEIEENKDA